MSGHQHAPAVLYTRQRPGTHCTGGWVVSRAGLDGRKISPHRDSIPGPSTGSQSLYRLSYRPTGRAWICKVFREICIRFCYFPPSILLIFFLSFLRFIFILPISCSSSPCSLFHPSNYPFTNSYLLLSRLLSHHQHSNLLPIYMMLFIHLLLCNHHCSDRHNNNA